MQAHVGYGLATPTEARPETVAAEDGPARVGPPAGRRPVPAASRAGVSVPLRVPWRTRMRATAGVLGMVVAMGTIVAVMLAMVALAVGQALAGL